MAVDAAFRQQGIGKLFMQRLVFPRTLELAENFGCVGTLVVGVHVDAKAEAVRFYERQKFATLAEATDATTQMFMPLSEVRAAVAPPL